MSHLYREHIRVRTYECDSFGHVNNAVYIQYLLQTTVDADGGTPHDAAVGHIRQLGIRYHVPAQYGDTLEVMTWRIGADDKNRRHGYRIIRPSDNALIAVAEIDWVSGLGHESHSAPARTDGSEALPGVAPAQLKPFAPPTDNGACPFRWRHQVRRYELDTTSHVGVAVYFNWLEEVTYRAAARVGWPLNRMHAENFMTHQYRHDAEFFDAAGNDDEIEIVSRLIDARRVRGTWIHEMYRLPTNTLMMRDYSTGAFLDLNGNIRAAPAEMMAALVQGEPIVKAD